MISLILYSLLALIISFFFLSMQKIKYLTLVLLTAIGFICSHGFFAQFYTEKGNEFLELIGEKPVLNIYTNDMHMALELSVLNKQRRAMAQQKAFLRLQSIQKLLPDDLATLDKLTEDIKNYSLQFDTIEKSRARLNTPK